MHMNTAGVEDRLDVAKWHRLVISTLPAPEESSQFPFSVHFFRIFDLGTPSHSCYKPAMIDQWTVISFQHLPGKDALLLAIA